MTHPMIVRGRRDPDAPRPPLKERIAALRLVPRLIGLVWETHRTYTALMIVLRLVRSAVPVSNLWVAKLIIDEVVTLSRSGGSARHLWFLVALEMGIVSKVVAPDELLGEARAKAGKLGAKAPHYVRMAKLLVGQSLSNSLTDHLQLERHGIADSMATGDLREGVTAFFEGREARFTGA